MNQFEPVLISWSQFESVLESVWISLFFHCWMSVDPVWTRAASHFQSVWISLNQLECVFNQFESVWIVSNKFDSVWMSVWISLNQFGSVWISLKHFLINCILCCLPQGSFKLNRFDSSCYLPWWLFFCCYSAGTNLNHIIF
mgnify:CR=1 FL=1